MSSFNWPPIGGGGGGGGANTNLSNLTAPLGINVNLLPDSPDNRDLGSATSFWAYAYSYGMSSFLYDIHDVAAGDFNGDLKCRLRFDNLTNDFLIAAISADTNIKLEPNGTGHVNVSSKQIKECAEPTAAQDAATKNYVDTALAAASGISFEESIVNSLIFG